MSTYNSANTSALLALRDVIEPVAGAATYTTGYIDAGTACQWLATITAGTVGTTCDAKIQQATDGSGTAVKDLSGSAITQLSGAGTAKIQFKPADLDIANDFTHIRLSITTVGASSVVAGLLESLGNRHEPQADGAKVDETITV